MGHTTRMATIIQYLLEKNYNVLFAGNEWQCRYIQDTFTGIETVHLDGYNVRYAQHALGFKPYFIQQLPRIFQVIRSEHQWLRHLATTRKIDAILSDNRYGLHHPEIPSVFITHQLRVQTGMGTLADTLFQRLHYRQIQRFQQCWVVDIATPPGLSGALGHPSQLPTQTSYLGWLSQLSNTDFNASSEQHILILLSGPEPQRSLLSSILWKEAGALQQPIVFIEGSQQAQEPSAIPAHISYHKLLTRAQLHPLLKNASMVVCRSGYSTLMDLMAAQKKAILIPTPGQTEQEYLGRYLHEKGIFYCSPQRQFSLSQSLQAATHFPFHPLTTAGCMALYKPVVDHWLQELP